VRVLLASDGSLTVESRPLDRDDRAALPAVIAVSKVRVDSTDPYLYHKTTRRDLYDVQLRNHPGCYDVIFMNEKDEITEGCYNTIVTSLNGELLTPVLDCGLLPGVLRAELIEVGAIREAVLTLNDLHAAGAIWLVNSVRGWRECLLISPFEKGGLGGI